jgi:uracil-DNA glycosylase
MTAESTATPEPDPREPRAIPRIEDAYLDKAIREMHMLEERMDACLGCATAGTFPVKASGSPTADVMLIKWQSSLAERQEGVSFFGRSGEAIRRSVERLGVDPAALYGTLVLKCPHADSSAPMGDELEWLAEEIRIVRPRILVVMGDRSIAAVDAMTFPMAEPLPVEQGVVTRWTPAMEALVTPDIDDSLDEQDAKRRFWATFRALGDWYAAEPPW